MILLALSLAVNLLSLDVLENTPLPLSTVIEINESDALKNDLKKAEIPRESPHNVLCVEVGWQRIKAAILPNEITYDHLKIIKTITAPSGIWLNANFPLLFKVTLPNYVTNRFAGFDV